MLVQHDLEQWHQLSLNQDSPGFGILKLVGYFAFFVRGVHGTKYGSNGGGGIQGDGVLWAIEREQANVIPFAYAQIIQTISNAVNHRDDLSIGQHEIVVNDGRAVGIAPRGYA